MNIKRFLLSLGQIFLILSLFIAVIALTQRRLSSDLFVNDYASSDVVYADGSTAHFDSKDFGMVNTGDVVTVHIALPETPLIENAVLCFYIYHSVTEIWWGDTLLDAYGADIAAQGGMIGNARFLVPIPDEAWGDEITLVFNVTEDTAFNKVKNLHIYEAQDAYQYHIDSDPVGFFVAFPLLIAGLVALLILLLNGRFDVSARKGLYIAAFAVLASVWIITSEGMQQLFGGRGQFWEQTEFIAVYTMVIPVLLYAWETESGGVFKKVLGGAAALDFAFFLVCTVLNFTNIAHYCKPLLISNALTFIAGLLLLIYAIRRQVRGNPSDKVFFNGMVIMFLAGLFDILRMNINKYIPSLISYTLPSVFSLGVLFFLIYQLRSYMMENKLREKTLMRAQVTAENLSEMFSNTPAGICLFSLEESFPILETNETFFAIFGYTPEQAKAAGFDSILFNLDEETRARFIAQYETFRDDPTPGTHEFPFKTRKADGQEISVLAKYHYHGCGENRITANVVDVTERERITDELRVSEERYRLALQQSGKVFFFFDVPSRTIRLSEELAGIFGLPIEVDNMPENPLTLGLVEPESADVYRDFYRRIIAGEASGDAVISCHMRAEPDKVLWYRIAFTSVFDAGRCPSSAIITYEDINAQYQSELAARWRQVNLVSLPESSYVVAEYDLTRGSILRQIGGLFAEMPPLLRNYEEINEFVLSGFIYEDDVERCRAFLDRKRLLALFAGGAAEDSIELRFVQHGSSYRWTSTVVQMVEDPYTGHVMGQFLFRDIHDEKLGQLQTHQDMEELKEQLEKNRSKVMLSQMQPHFLYNALSAIQTIVKVDPDYAYDLIYDFTVHLRASIKALSSDEPIPFKDEVKNIKAYLNIAQMRWRTLRVNYDIDCDDFRVVPLSIQPIAENAARHGIYPKGKEGGTVTVRSYETADAYVVEVEDDGVGFDVNAVMTSEGDSVGLKNVMFRLKALMNADVSIYSRPGEGTRVTVTIPKEDEL